MENPTLSLAASAIVSLLVIFVVLFGVGFLLRRLRAAPWDRRSAAASPIQLIASRPLGGQNTLIIVEAEGQRFLIAVSHAGMQAIGRLGGQ